MTDNIVPVSEAARGAAASYNLTMRCGFTDSHAIVMRRGESDDHEIVKAFAGFEAAIRAEYATPTASSPAGSASPSIDQVARLIAPGAFQDGDVGGVRHGQRELVRTIARQIKSLYERTNNHDQ